MVPEDYMSVMRIVFKKLFRVYAHVYHHHLTEFIKQDAEVHLNTSFKYFGMFVREFELISKKEEAPLRKLLETYFLNIDFRVDLLKKKHLHLKMIPSDSFQQTLAFCFFCTQWKILCILILFRNGKAYHVN